MGMDVDIEIPGNRGAPSPVKIQNSPSCCEEASPSSQEVSAIMADLEALEVGSPVTPEDEEIVESPGSVKSERWSNPTNNCDPLGPSGEALLESDPWEHTEIPLDFLQELGLMRE